MLDAEVSRIGGETSYAATFARPLLDPLLPVPISVSGPRFKAAQRRYNVYRNNVTVSLINALAATFPATMRITGPNFFRAMARSHVRATPPRSPLLFEYGHDFPEFIYRYEYARSVPWLADIARIERAWLDAYHAADTVPLTLDCLSLIPPERLAKVVLRKHPATKVVVSRFPAVSIYVANCGNVPARSIETNEPEDALVTRPSLEVVVRRLPPGGAVFLTSLMVGEALGTAAASAFAASANFDLAANIAGSFAAGAFAAIEEESYSDDV